MLVLASAACVAVIATAVQVHQVTRPGRVGVETIDFDAVMMQVEEVEFLALDGLRLKGWFIEGRADLAPIVLCHDIGATKASLTNLAVALRKAGYPVLVFDFRGHGDSEGEGSTLGLKEKRDVLGALAYLEGRFGPRARRVGIYGTGMGAHAAVLAAAERAAPRVLVLDRLHPDVGYTIAHRTYDPWKFGVERLAFLPLAVFSVMNQTSIHANRAADLLDGLLGRDLLLLAPKSDPRLTAEMLTMTRSVPDQPDVDANLEILEATQGDGLFGPDLDEYHLRVTGFFEARLRPVGTQDVAQPAP